MFKKKNRLQGFRKSREMAVDSSQVAEKTVEKYSFFLLKQEF